MYGTRYSLKKSSLPRPDDFFPPPNTPCLVSLPPPSLLLWSAWPSLALVMLKYAWPQPSRGGVVRLA